MLVLSIVTTLIAGVVPAFRASRADLTHVLKDDSRGASSLRLGRLTRGLVVFEVALSCALLIAAGLSVRSFFNLRRADLGFDISNLFIATVSPRGQAYADSALPRFYERLDEALRPIAGFETYTLTTGMPTTGPAVEPIALDGVTYERPQDQPRAMRISMSPSYPAVLGVQLLEGRNFTDADRAGGALVALVDRDFAEKHLWA